MPFPSLLSTILRSAWLIEPAFAQAQLPLVMQLMEGRDVQFDIPRFSHPSDNHSEVDPAHLPDAYHFTAIAGAPNVYSVGRYTDFSRLPNNSIALMTISGPVMKEDQQCGPAGMVSIAKQIRDAKNASNVAGLIINLDSPGGQASGTNLLATAIREMASEKPVIVHINDGMAASAGMWISAAASEIYVAHATDQVGSIGVYTTIADFIKYYESKGLTVKEIYAPQSTDKNKEFYDAFNGNEQPLKDQLAVLADQFINAVSTYRAGKIKGDSWKTGKMFYAEEAKKIGLIDGIKSFDQVVSRIQTLINQKQKSQANTMAFEKTLVAAKAESFAVTDDGFVATEEHLNNIEAHITALEQVSENSAQELTSRNEQISTLTTQLAEQATELQTTQASLQTAEAKITEMQGQIDVLMGKASGGGSKLKTGGDDSTEESKSESGLPRYDSPEHPANKAASRFIRKKQ